MRLIDQYGYGCLFTGLAMFYLFDFHIAGFFFQGMALGLFLKSGLDQIKNKKR